MPKYTAEEVKKHRTKDDCWIILGDNVLDVTKYLEKHPGGADMLLEYAGKDATEAFEDEDHSSTAQKITKQYVIGELKE